MDADGIVISGVGALGAHGAALEELRAALERGTPELRPVDTSQGFHLAGGARAAALVPELEWAGLVAPAAMRRMSQSSRLLVAAGRLALASAALPAPRAVEPEWSLDVATTFGPARYAELLLGEILVGDPRLCSPYLFTDCVASAPAGQLALQLQAGGPSTTHCQREAGPVLALLGAAERLRLRQAAVAFAGAVDELPPILHALLDRFGALVRPGADGERARPYHAARAGCLAGEGASVLVCEPEAGARHRDAPILARLRAHGRGFDPSAGPHDVGDGAAVLAGIVRRGLARAGCDLGTIDGVVGGASGARRGDRLEGRLLRALFGRQVPPVFVPKAVTGEHGGGVLPSALLALQGLALPPVPGFVPEPELELTPHAGRFAPARVLVTACATGGAFAFAVLERA